MTKVERFTHEEARQVSETLIEQLGGGRKLRAMIGASGFLFSKDGKTTFQFKGSRKINMVSITLNDLDYYDIRFYKLSNKNMDLKLVCEDEMVCATDLKAIFELTTGLYLSL